jgi:osmotically inducible lipoprotein OsmB
MMMARLGILLAAVLVLAACGTTTEDRAIGGGAIGAGALGGALTGNPAAGALLAARREPGGALTSPNQVDLGKPAWR